MSPLPVFDPSESSQQLGKALASFIERLEEDRNILAAVRVGSFDEGLMWWKESIGLWIIEADGVSRRLKSDGDDVRTHRTFVENGINFHAEIIPRSRFRHMVEGSSRTAFSASFFAKRDLVYCDDPSIGKWFDAANTIATRDQEKERLIAMTRIIRSARYTRKRIERKNDLELGFESLMWAVHSVASVEVINDGAVWEHAAIYRAIELQPKLFKQIYTDVISKKRTKKSLLSALEQVDHYVEDNALKHLRPILKFLEKENRTVPLSHISEHFAHSQIYPGHIETACEWLERAGIVEKLAMPFRITKKSRTDVEEPAYFYDPD
ncbi:hypothetical protein [Mariniblastus fucicola]|uniref:Nucleotidyltransferase n=1 Tax=Mariniblastus fucicola TaxID=980251 RepID=A0A5B9PRU4_9BACT|nr:hypothetical protein [Mariniblastus fucicola]QEG24973.1 hypothetical protein MFFC18_48960 [Mariniblastus fucicola]